MSEEEIPGKEATFKEIIDGLTENTQAFVKTNVKLVQLEVYERTTNLISSGINLSIIVILVLFILFFLNFGIAQFIGEQLGRPSFGYMIVAGFYLLALLVFLLIRKSWKKKNTIKNAILKSVSKTYDDFDELLEEQLVVDEEKEASLAKIEQNIADLKLKVYGEEEDEEGEGERASILPRPLLTTAFNFIFRRFVFKKQSVIKNKLTPLFVSIIVESIIYGEDKLITLYQRIKSNFYPNKED